MDTDMPTLQRIVNLLKHKEIIESIEVHTINEPLLQKMRLLEELDEVQKNSICNMIDTAIANKRLTEALSNAMSITI